jgi:hypothetical protein
MDTGTDWRTNVIVTGTRGFGSRKVLTRYPYPPNPTREPDGLTRTRVLHYESRMLDIDGSAQYLGRIASGG